MFFEHMKHEDFPFPNCANRNVFVSAFTLCIPIFEFLLYPFFRNYVPRTTVRIALGVGVSLLGLSALLALDAVGHHQLKPGDQICMFYAYAQHKTLLHLNPNLLVPVIFVMVVGEMLVYISTLEFICAQTPYGMRGLIIGIYFMIYGGCVGLLSLVMLVFAEGYRRGRNHGGTEGPGPVLSCGTSYLTVVVGVGVVGLLVYLTAAKCYRSRQRGGQRDVNDQTILEGYYET